MATIQRPTKQGNATTYQGKVAAGYTKILAAEVDADLDLIYSAWNQGVDTVNIQDGSITGAKLAPGSVGTRELQDGGIQTVDLGDGQVTTPKLADGAVQGEKLIGGGVMGGDLAGSYPNPTVSAIFAGLLRLNPRGAMAALSTTLDIQANAPDSLNYQAADPTWLLRFDYVNDTCTIFRAPPPGTAFVAVLSINSAGRLTANLIDGAVVRSMLAVNAPNGTPVSVSPPASFLLTTPNTWTTVATLPSLTTRGGLVHLHANHNLSALGPTGGSVCSQRWMRDGVSVTAWSFPIAASNYVPFPGINFIDNPAAGAHVYSYQVLVQTSCFISGSNVNDGIFQAVEVG